MALSMLYSDEEKFRKRLDEIVADINTRESDKYNQVSCMADMDRVRIATTVLTNGVGERVDLIHHKKSEGDDPEEVVLTLQGYVVQCNLPPLVNKGQLAKHPENTQQLVRLTGLGTEPFELAAKGISQIRAVLGDSLQEDSLQSWSPARIRNHLVLTFTNRYFSNERDGVYEVQDLSPSYDPLRLLRLAVPGGLHTVDNQVLYFERIKTATEGRFTHRSVLPSSIKVGHMVEVQCGFCAIPVNRRKYRFLCKLRSVCILDRSVENACNLAAVTSTAQLPQPIVVRRMKRRVGYEEDTDEEEAAGLFSKRLRLEEDKSEGSDKMAD